MSSDILPAQPSSLAFTGLRLFLGGCAVMCLLAALYLFWIGYYTALIEPVQQAHSLSRQRLPTATSLADLRAIPVGQTAMIQGQIDPATPSKVFSTMKQPEPHRLVMYTVMKLNAKNEWEAIESTSQPFNLVLTDGSVAVVNQHYLYGSSESWDTLPNGNALYGIAVGETVLIHGKIVAGAGGTAIEAFNVSPGTIETYLATTTQKPGDLAYAHTLGTIEAVIALVPLAAGVVLAWLMWNLKRNLKSATA